MKSSAHQLNYLYDEWTQIFEQLCQQEKFITDGSITLNQYLTIYFSNAKNFLSPIVFEKYDRIISKYISPLFGAMSIREIKPIHIQCFINLLCQMEYSGSTVRRYYTILQSIMRSAYKLGVILDNPADNRRITLPVIAEKETEIFTPEEVKVMFDFLENEPLKLKLLIHLAINTGCRRGELVALKWSDLDFSTGIVTVSRSNYKLKGEKIQSKSTKSNKIRRIVLSSYCISLLKQHQKEQANDKISCDDWIFTQSNGNPMYPTTPTLQFSRFLKKYNLPHKKFHSLRHTSATLLLINGNDIKSVGQRLGHTQIKTTNRYVHAVAAADKKAANTFEAMFGTYDSKNI